MKARVLIAAAGGGFVVVAVGVFAGMWLWGQWGAHQAAVEAAKAASAAEAFAATPLGRQRKAVLAALNDPEGATFRNEQAAPRDPTVWCGQVNAKNRMGAFAGFTRYMVDMEPGAEMAPLDQVRFEPSTRDAGGLLAFMKRWDTLCER